MRLANVLPAPSALLKLFARWMALGSIGFVTMAVALPLLFLGDTGFRVFTGHALSSDFNTSAARQVVLHLGVTVPLFLAALTSAAAGEMLGTPMAWSLPNVRRKILSGHVMIVLLITAIVTVFASRRVESHTAMIAMCMVPFWYAVGAGWPTMYRWPRIGLPLIVFTLLAVFKPVWYVTAVTVAPFNIIVVGMALLFAVVSLLSQAGAPWGRAVVAATMGRTHTGESVGSFFTPFLDRRRHGDVSADRYGGTRHSLTQWINAAFVESARSVWQGMFFRMVFVALFAALLYIFSSQIGLMAMVIAQSGPQLSGVLPYPLSRRQRAHVQFACNLLETLLTGGAVWLVFTLLEANGAQRFADNVSMLQFQRRWPMEFAALVVCMPFAQWARALGPLPVNTMANLRAMVPTALLIGVVVAIPRLLDRLLAHPPLSTILLVLAATGVVVQVLYYVALRHVYARRDLWRR